LIQVFLVLVQKTGQSFLRTVRGFLGESRGETPLGDIGFDWGELGFFREVLGIIGRFLA
jgi:hypothetical protein